MKKLLFIVVTGLAFGSIAKAQQSKYGKDSATCHENLYIYYELAKKKQYAEAYDAWKVVYDTCPQSSKNNFIFGPYIVEAKLKKAETEEEKQKFTKLLMKVYDNRLKYFPDPEKTDYVKGKKALDMMQHMPDSSQQAFKLFDEAFDIGGPEQSAAFYNGYFIAAARLFNKKTFEAEDIFQAYNKVIEGIEYNTDLLNRKITKLQEQRDSTSQGISSKEEQSLAKYKRELERYKKTENNIEKILGPIATCDKLKLLYNDSSFTENKADTTWLRRATKMLQKERKNKKGEYDDCTSLPIFYKISAQLYELEPSVSAARGMGRIAYQKDNYSEAAKYFKEAIEQEVDPLEKADDYVRLAGVYQKMGSLASAKNAAVKATQLKDGWGKPYLVLAGIYAQADGVCGSDAFEKQAVYWAAIDKLQYAKSIDPSVASRADQLIASYRQQLPDKSTSFQLGHQGGEKHTIGCFINETVTVEF